MKIIMMALLVWLLKLAVTLIISWAARERLKRMSRKQKGFFFAGLWGAGVATFKIILAWF
ncbi:TPA: hypothetical protein OMU28_002038 [Klebsiella aerogenes]|nr:hypothetical protein [Klebsiella aerogenes]